MLFHWLRQIIVLRAEMSEGSSIMSISEFPAGKNIELKLLRS